jgi:hypothetical protein
MATPPTPATAAPAPATASQSPYYDYNYRYDIPAHSWYQYYQQKLGEHNSQEVHVATMNGECYIKGIYTPLQKSDPCPYRGCLHPVFCVEMDRQLPNGMIIREVRYCDLPTLCKWSNGINGLYCQDHTFADVVSHYIYQTLHKQADTAGRAAASARPPNASMPSETGKTEKLTT